MLHLMRSVLILFQLQATPSQLELVELEQEAPHQQEMETTHLLLEVDLLQSQLLVVVMVEARELVDETEALEAELEIL